MTPAAHTRNGTELLCEAGLHQLDEAIDSSLLVCVISLSDRLTPWEVIEKRLACAAQGDFALALYNPSSKGRPDYLRRAVDILLANGKAPDTLCGSVRNIGREGQEKHILPLSQLRDTEVDMFTTVFVGNAATRALSGRMVTPRGYRR